MMDNHTRIRTINGYGRGILVSLAVSLAVGAAAHAADPMGPNDNLNSTLWTQKSVEFKGHALGAYKLAEIMLDRALADKNWTAAIEQTGNYQDLPPAVILDVDETVLDNSAYQAWMVREDKRFSMKTWAPFVNTASSMPIPGALEFTKYADGKGVKVFYVSNRNGKREEATRKNLMKYGFPMGGNVDTVLLKREKPEWGSKKGNRRAHVAKDYRILLLLGDNFGDFVDGYKGSPQARHDLMMKHKERWGTQWIVLANPTYGSWESAPFGFNYKLPDADKRRKKIETMRHWVPQPAK